MEFVVQGSFLRVQQQCTLVHRLHSFGRDYRVPIDMMYNVRNDDRKFSSITGYERTLRDLYNVARESMQVRQAAAATYYDKVVDGELQLGELVYVLSPLNKSNKLALKLFCPSETVKCCHPAYEILVGNNTKWVTRDKLKRAAQGVNIQVEPDQPDIVTPPEEPDEVITSSDSASDDSDIEVPVVRGRGSYELRPDPGRTQVLNDIYVHSVFVKNFCS